MKAKNSNPTSEFEFHPERMKRVPPGKRHRTSSGETALRNFKVRVTIYLDADVVEDFKKRAAASNAAPYQTQINAALREFLAGSTGREERSRLLHDEHFLDAVSKRVRARLR